MASGLPIDVLEDIFLRLDDMADLARASAACASFRRVVTDSRFRRRFSSLHRRPVLGLLLHDRHHETGLFRPAQSPRRRRHAAACFAEAADFTFSFLPDRSRWLVCDVRDGRVLLARCRGPHHTFEDLVAYDPLHRRHVQIPTIPGDLIPSGEAMTFDNPFLAPDFADERDDDAGEGFRVMCTALSRTTKVVAALVFSSASAQWRRVASFSNPRWAWTNIPKVWSRQYVHSCSCFCWTHEASDVMLVFDTREMKFSVADLPRESSNGEFKMAVEAGDGRFGLLLLRNGSCSATVDLYSKPWQGIQEEAKEWKWELDSSATIPGFQFKMLAAVAGGYVLLRGTRIGEKKHKARYFTVDLKTETETLLVDKLCVLEDDSSVNFLYAGFPPPFSPPSV